MAHRGIFNRNADGRWLLAGVRILTGAGAITVGLVNAPPILAQSQPTEPLAFEVASVKPHTPGDNRFSFPGFLPGGRFVSHVPLLIVIATAYNLPFNPSVRLSGGPDWLRSRTAFLISKRRPDRAQFPPDYPLGPAMTG
jgi:hypothetical protein